MRHPAARQRARGALQEIPIAVAIVLISVGVLMDHVGVSGKKFLVAVDGLALLVLFYYYLLATGWRPGAATTQSLLPRRIWFALLAILVIGLVVGFALVYTGR